MPEPSATVWHCDDISRIYFAKKIDFEFFEITKHVMD